jgi:hypothetical protein
MTCEVAVMNKRGVALAADSAVTLGDGKKVYHTAEKLFQLSSSAPVGVMTYGAADLMEVPWETVIKLYAQRLGERRFDRLEQYAQDFLRFIEGSESLFPASAQRQSFRQAVAGYWNERYLEPLKTRLDQDKKHARNHAGEILMQLISRDHEQEWKNSAPLPEMGDSYGDRILDEYGTAIDELETEMFGELRLSSAVKKGLRTTARFMYANGFDSNTSSGVVIAGIGETEAFPVVLCYQVGTIAAGKLRFVRIDESRVGHESDGVVIPLAQRHVIDMFYGGISPRIKERLGEIIAGCLKGCLKSAKLGQAHALAEKCGAEIMEKLEHEAQEFHTQPLTRAVAGLPRRELAGLAEALVSLTAFIARMSVDQQETVGGPIDVALISKGDGFVWIKRKDPVRDTLVL